MAIALHSVLVHRVYFRPSLQSMTLTCTREDWERPLNRYLACGMWLSGWPS